MKKYYNKPGNKIANVIICFAKIKVMNYCYIKDSGLTIKINEADNLI